MQLGQPRQRLHVADRATPSLLPAELADREPPGPLGAAVDHDAAAAAPASGSGRRDEAADQP